MYIYKFYYFIQHTCSQSIPIYIWEIRAIYGYKLKRHLGSWMG